MITLDFVVILLSIWSIYGPCYVISRQPVTPRILVTLRIFFGRPRGGATAAAASAATGRLASAECRAATSVFRLRYVSNCSCILVQSAPLRSALLRQSRDLNESALNTTVLNRTPGSKSHRTSLTAGFRRSAQVIGYAKLI